MRNRTNASASTHGDRVSNHKSFQQDSTQGPTQFPSSKKIFIICFIFRIANALFVQTYFNPDEHWQALEVAHRVTFGYGHLTWEWTKGIRSYFHPMLFAVLYKVLSALHLDTPLFMIKAPRLFQSVFSAFGDLYLFKLSNVLYGSHVAQWALFAQLTNWFMFFCITRTLSNSLETVVTVISLYYWPCLRVSSGPGPPVSRTWALVTAAIACAIRPTSAIIWVYVGLMELIGSRDRLKFVFLQVLPIGLLIRWFAISACHLLSRTWADSPIFLGIEILYSGQDILLSQQKYINELLQRASLSNAHPVDSPITPSAKLALGDSSPFENPVKYRQVVGALQYVTLSRPDITYAVNKVCQFMHSPTENQWLSVKRILRYLKGTATHGLLIKQQSPSVLHAYTDASFNNLSAFSDADWAGCSDDRRSTGGAIYLGSNLVSWSARKQKTVSRSSTESEYKALADTIAELTWLQALLHELHVPARSAPTLWCDNLGATYLVANPVFHERTKHAEVDFHFVREQVAQRKLSVQFISTEDQIADVFTKALPSPTFLFLRSKLRVASRP